MASDSFMRRKPSLFQETDLQDPQIRKALVRESFYLFWWYYFPHYHKDSIPAYKIPIFGKARSARMLDIEPRDHGKSAPWSCAYPLWCTLTNPFDQPMEILGNGAFVYERGYEEVISQVSAAGKLPRRWIRRHKRELEYNRSLINDWGWQSTKNLANGEWQNEALLLRNGGHIYSRGSGAQIRGDHPTEAVIDDLEDRKEVQNPDIRADNLEYFFADLYGGLEPMSRCKVFGTMLHQDCLLAYLWKNEIKPPVGADPNSAYAEKWIKFRFAALLPDGQPLAPEIWPLEALLWRRANIPTKMWWSEYMNQPLTSENPVFPPNYFQAAHNGFDNMDPDWQKEFRNKLRMLHFCDYAVGDKETNDWDAIITAGVDLRELTKPKVFILQIQRFHKSFYAKVGQAIQTWVKWRGTIGFEGIAFASYISQEFHRACEEQHWSPDYYTTNYRDRKVEGYEPPKRLDKVSRAQFVQEFFELNQVHFNYKDPMTAVLVDEMTIFPEGAHDDMVDALVGLLWEVKRIIQFEKNKEKQIIPVRYDAETGAPQYVFDDRRDTPDDYFGV